MAYKVTNPKIKQRLTSRRFECFDYEFLTNFDIDRRVAEQISTMEGVRSFFAFDSDRYTATLRVGALFNRKVVVNKVRRFLIKNATIKS